MNLEDEKQFLEEKSYTYRNIHSKISEWSVQSYIKIYKKYLDKNCIKGLELGCSNGYSTKCLSELITELDVVDGSKHMIENASKQIERKNVSFKYALFEELDLVEKYDCVFCSYVLEHVVDPKKILDICYKLLKQGGKMFITVPNANALSRQMALEMGILKNLYSLTENDKAHGHRRVFDLEKLYNLVNQSSFTLVDIGGTFVKQFADFQINQMIDLEIIGTDQLQGMQKLAEKYPDISGSIYAILEKKS